MNQENSLPKIGELLTEARNAASENLDTLSTVELLQVINDADKGVALAVERELANIATAVDLIVERIDGGGRLFYVGAGTSGRLGVLDASECPPTFSVPATLVVGNIAGGDSALRRCGRVVRLFGDASGAFLSGDFRDGGGKNLGVEALSCGLPAAHRHPSN